MSRGHLLLVLHCHLPYVRHPEHEDFLEEDWFFEAVAETYVPLLQTLEGLYRDGVPFRVTLSFSPTLCEMLENALLQERCVRYLERRVELAAKEVVGKASTPFAEAARMYRRHYETVHETFAGRCGRRLLPAFARLAADGDVELLGSAATHALLPLMGTPEARRAQVALGLRSFARHFGGRPQGFWLPECAYGPGLDALLGRFGIRYFFLDTHGVLLAEPRPPHGVFAPLETPAGTYAFGRDFESSRQVWSAREGYPGDPAYREFHRDLGFDAGLEYLRPYLPADGVRRPLGFKYHRVTGDAPLGRKEPYGPAAAAERAKAHAAHFVSQRAAQAAAVAQATGLDPVIVCPYDAELFGHWWWEGPQFLAEVFRLVAGRDDLEWVTGSECLDNVTAGARQQGRPAQSTWGNGGYFDVWVNPASDWMYPMLLTAEASMVQSATLMPRADGLLRRALNQCARSLMLAEASDWPFLISTDSAAQYARRRFTDLLGRFSDLMAQVRAGRVDESLLERCEFLDDAFPEADYTLFGPRGQPARPGR
jgi:1,4-alpha-glucan branching enzyme